jgi:glutamate racemase
MKKIGIIDSGIGGLTLLKEMINSRYEAEFYYISDETNVPYGEKSQEFMFERTKLMVGKLIEKQVDTIVLACNTLTAETIDKLRTEYQIHFVGIEPYLNFLNNIESNDASKIGLILTVATYNSKRFKQLQQKIDPQNEISIFPMKKLAQNIEKLKYDDSVEVYSDIKNELSTLKNSGLSHLILGCTHYPIIKNIIEDILNVKTVDPNIYVLNHISSLIQLVKSNEIKTQFFYNANLGDKWESIKLNEFKFFS